eukprot:2788423-Amphidinium_carterae.5
MAHPSTRTPLPQPYLESKRIGYEPNLIQPGTLTPGVKAALMPPPPAPPLSGRGDRRGPYGLPGRVPVTPPAIASMAPPPPPANAAMVPGDADDMDLGEPESLLPDNPMAIAELVEHLTETSTTTLRRVDTLRIDLKLQQHDVLHKEQHATLLRQEYLQAVAAMESYLVDSLGTYRTLGVLPVTCGTTRSSSLDEVGRFEQGLINRFAQSEQLAFNDGMTHPPHEDRYHRNHPTPYGTGSSQTPSFVANYYS